MLDIHDGGLLTRRHGSDAVVFAKALKDLGCRVAIDDFGALTQVALGNIKHSESMWPATKPALKTFYTTDMSAASSAMVRAYVFPGQKNQLRVSPFTP